MIDAPTAALLLDVLRRESRSLLQYVSETFPWPTPEGREALTRLEGLIAEERRGLAALGRFLVRHRVIPPPLGPYPQEYTTINFVSFDHLLPLLVEDQRQAIAHLERDRAAVTDAEARSQVEQILSLKRQHLQALEALAAADPEKANAPTAAVST
jgi:hypothetical protein